MAVRVGSLVLVALVLLAFSHWPSAQAQTLGWTHQETGVHATRWISGVVSDADGNFYSGGYEEYPDSSWLQKHRPDGSTIWSIPAEAPAPGSSWGQVYGEIKTLALDQDGLYTAGAVSWNPNSGFSGRTTGFLQRRSPATGALLWQVATRMETSFAGSFSEGVHAVTTDGAGNLYVVGWVDLAGYLSRPGSILVAAYTTDGTQRWMHFFGSSSNDRGTSIAVDASGVYVAGTTNGPILGNPPGSTASAFLRKYDIHGNVLWTQAFPGQHGAELRLATNPQGGVYLTGHGSLTRVSTGGQTVWSVPSGAQTVVVDGHGTVVTAGSASSQDGDADVRLQAFSAAGASRWSHQYGSSHDDLVQWIASDRDHGAYIGGWTYGTMPGATPTSGGKPDTFVSRVQYDPANPVPTITPTAPPTPTFPGARGKIAFTSNRANGQRDIYVMNADGAQPTLLTSASPSDESPSWSPDGSKIAFASHRDGNPRIYVMNADGSEQVRLTAFAQAAGQPSFAPDGMRIAYMSDYHVYVMGADGSNPQRITAAGDAGGYPDWSPDGQKIVYAGRLDSRQGIIVVNADGAQGMMLVPSNGSARAPAWSPDGREIAFSSACGQSQCIYLMSANGSNLRPVTSQTDAFDYPAWSPAGDHIIMEGAAGGSQSTSLYVVRRDGTGLVRLTVREGQQRYDGQPDWIGEGGPSATTTVGTPAATTTATATSTATASATATATPLPTVPTITTPLPGTPVPVDALVQQISASGSYLPSDPRAPAGVYRVTFRFQNVSPQTFADLQARITQLTGGHIIVNRDGAPSSTPAGVGSVVSVPGAALGLDGHLVPTETFTQVIEIGLQRREPFRITFTGTGVSVGATSTSARADSAAVQRAGASTILTASADFAPGSAEETGSPGPTRTMTPSPQGAAPSSTLIASPSACTPRPTIEVRTTQVGPGQIEAIITTEATSGSPANSLRSIRLTGRNNADLRVVGGPPLSEQSPYAPNSGTREIRLLVTRAQPGPMTAHLTIEDSCGSHVTFVGAGGGIR